jgi:hypothetical protein
MRRELVRIGVLLAGGMLVLFGAWEAIERLALGETGWTGKDTFHLVRGTTSAAMLALLAAWLISRWHRRNEELLRRQSQEFQLLRQFAENTRRMRERRSSAWTTRDVCCRGTAPRRRSTATRR